MQLIKSLFSTLKFKYNHLCYGLKLKGCGKNVMIIKPLYLRGLIDIGDYSIILEKTWLEANPLTGEDKAQLKIGNHCTIGHFNEIYATKSIVIEDYVLTADRVYISDNLHRYENINIPIIKQSIKQIGTVRIGEGSWLGVGVAVIGANIGKHCVIGANAVVTKDIPDYCVAVGIPAKIIKRYNFETKKWERTLSDGSFIR